MQKFSINAAEATLTTLLLLLIKILTINTQRELPQAIT